MGWMSDWWNGTGEKAERDLQRIRTQEHIWDLRRAEEQSKDPAQREWLWRRQRDLLDDWPDCLP